MPKLRRFQNNFTTGEVSPDLHERYDFAKRENALETMRNLLLRPTGGAQKRPGSRFVAEAREPKSAGRVRLIPFTFSREQAYVLELGALYMRFYRDGGQLVMGGGGSPVEIPTPWTIDQVPAVDFAQSADTMVLVHPDVEPQVLQRFSDINWRLNPLNARPEPTEPTGWSDTAVTLNLALSSGNIFDVTAVGGNAFTGADVGRTLREQGEQATGVGIFTLVTSPTAAQIEVISNFTSLSLGVDPLGLSEWLIEGAPLANLAVLKTSDGTPAEGTQGERVTLSAYLENENPSILTNSDFSSGLAGWTDLSGQQIFFSVHSGGGGNDLITGDDLRAEGVRPNHLVENVTTGDQEGLVSSIVNDTAIGTNPNNVAKIVENAITWSTNDNFRVKDTGRVRLISGGAGGTEFLPGENGAAILEQSFATVAYRSYQFEVEIENDAVSIQIGTASGLSDVVEEVTLTPGTRKGFFQAPVTPTALFLQVRNNQNNTASIVKAIIVREVGTAAFDFQVKQGDIIRLNGGFFEATADGVQNLVSGTLLTALDDVEDAVPGSWTAEKSQWAEAFPHAVTFYQQRLVLAWSLQVGGSNLLDFRNFALGALGTSAYRFQPAATQVNQSLWLLGSESLTLGTRAEEYVIQGTETAFIAADDINPSSPSAEGSEAVQPQRAVDTILFVKAGGKRIMEFQEDIARDSTVTRDLSIIADHLVEIGDKIVEIAWQKELEQVLWCVTQNGRLYSLSYIRSQDIWAWARHDSADGATFLSVAVIPHPDSDRDQVWLAVDRPAGGRHYVEFLDDGLGLFTENLATMVDSTVRYDGPSTTLISGLTHLEGQGDVWVVDVNGVQGPLRVLSGTVTFERAVSRADIGIRFEPEIRTLRPAIDGASPTGLVIGNTNLFIRLLETGDGVKANGKILKLRRPTDLMDTRIVPVTGDIEIPSIGHDRSAVVVVAQSIPETFYILSVAGTIDVENP